MEDREVLACMRSLIAEQHWLRERRSQLVDGDEMTARSLDRRIQEVSDNLATMLDKMRAMRAAAVAPETTRRDLSA